MQLDFCTKLWFSSHPGWKIHWSGWSAVSAYSKCCPLSVCFCCYGDTTWMLASAHAQFGWSHHGYQLTTTTSKYVSIETVLPPAPRVHNEKFKREGVSNVLLLCLECVTWLGMLHVHVIIWRPFPNTLCIAKQVHVYGEVQWLLATYIRSMLGIVVFDTLFPSFITYMYTCTFASMHIAHLYI